ncbi:Selenoprotein H [Trichoplax sp. H2]|nr:Selenoprotein H [Trichoplax sp. H2]|eukprot:RDD36509.1 Selenoprotein H [Trichoplax sp. H2]
MALRGEKGKNSALHKAANGVSTTKKLKAKRAKAQTVRKFVIERRRKAEELTQALLETFPNVEVSINPEKARPASFECQIVTEEGNEILLWTGINRLKKVKFPEPKEVIDATKMAL